MEPVALLILKRPTTTTTAIFMYVNIYVLILENRLELLSADLGLHCAPLGHGILWPVPALHGVGSYVGQ